MQIAALFRFLGAGLFVFLAGVTWGQRRNGPAVGAVFTLLTAMAVWNAAWPAALWPLEWIAAVVAAGAALWLRRAASRPFAIAFAALMTGWAAGLAIGSHSVPAAVGSLAAGVYLAGSFYWKQTFGVVLTHRSLFAVSLGMFAAVYMFGVRVLASVTNWGWALELAALFGAGLLWVPIYSGVNRFIRRRTEMLSLLDGASTILDREQRMRYIAAQVASRFAARSAVLTFGGLQVRHGEAEGHEYRVPLPLQGVEAGVLTLIPQRERFRNDEESLLRALAPHIAQSLDVCRLIEEKIRLENLAQLGAAAAAIAHEVKNPLGAIKTLTQLMGEDASIAASHGESLRFIAGEVDRLDRSVRQLLGFARQPPERKESVDVSLLVQTLVSHAAAPAGVAIEADVEPGLALPESNEDLLRQALWNLLLNAAEAARSRVSVRARREGPAIVIEVEDDGPGIPADLREKAFAPFYTTKLRGTGLGLAIVRNNVRALGGDITVTEAAGGGAAFKLALL